MRLNRHDSLRTILAAALVLIIGNPLRAADENLDPSLGKPSDDGKLLWYDVRELGVEGRGWEDTKSFYNRLPAKAEGVVRPPVWDLSQHSAGMAVRFVTDATQIHGRWTVTSSNLAMPHMPATAVSGLDLYARDDDGQWRWLGVGEPTATTNTAQLAGGIKAGRRGYLLYLPLYNGVTSVEIGIPKDKSLAKAPARAADNAKPIVFWGTSITQGGCASRAGMVHTAILGRRFDRPVINLGFSGNGKLEPEVAELLAELDPAVYVIDCLPNCTADEVIERMIPVVTILRKAHPETPIVLVEDRNYTNGFLVTSRKERNNSSQAALRAAFSTLHLSGVPNLHYIKGAALLGGDGEGTVDGSHPTDLGFLRQADAFAKILGPILRPR